MINIIKKRITFFSALVAFPMALYWAYKSDWAPEPLIVLIPIVAEMLLYLLLPGSKGDDANALAQSPIPGISNVQNVNVNLSLGDGEIVNKGNKIEQSASDRTAAIDYMKLRTSVLFIDDDKNFKVVKILKDSGWKNTRTVTDVKTLDLPNVKTADILFVDINGVGKLLNLEYEGLDLALMLKQKYKTKKVIIYSANKTSNSFHRAWDECDYKLEKNALPYQFENLVEEYSFENYKKQR